MNDMAGRVRVSLTLNGHPRTLEVAPHELLLDTLRVSLGATDVRYGCGEGVCGTCTVLIEGEPVSACLVLTVQAHERSISTVRGAQDDDGTLRALQRAFLERGAAQCGFCTPGMLLTLLAAIREGAADRAALREAIAGNLCRCTGYRAILDAAEAVVREVGSPSVGADR